MLNFCKALSSEFVFDAHVLKRFQGWQPCFQGSSGYRWERPQRQEKVKDKHRSTEMNGHKSENLNLKYSTWVELHNNES